MSSSSPLSYCSLSQSETSFIFPDDLNYLREREAKTDRTVENECQTGRKRNVKGKRSKRTGKEWNEGAKERRWLEGEIEGERENEWNDRMITSRTVYFRRRETGLKRLESSLPLDPRNSGGKWVELGSKRRDQRTGDTDEQGSNRMAMFHDHQSVPLLLCLLTGALLLPKECLDLNLLWTKEDNISYHCVSTSSSSAQSLDSDQKLFNSLLPAANFNYTLPISFSLFLLLFSLNQ